MADKLIPKRSDLDIVQDWAKYLYKDFSDDILENLFRNGGLLESLDYTVTQKDDRIETVFTYLLYGAFGDMGLNAHGYSFKPRKWYARNVAYSTGKLGEMMLKRYGALGMVRLSELFPDRIVIG